MAVKDLIGLFDSPPHSAAGRGRHRSSEVGTTDGGQIEASLPPPTPARFIKHTNLKDERPVPNKSRTMPVNSQTIFTTDMPSHDNANDNEESSEITLDVTEEAHNYLDTSFPMSDHLSAVNQQPVVSEDTEMGQVAEEQLHLLAKNPHRYPPQTPRKGSLSSTSTLVPRSRNRLTHKPVPAITLFARKAAPLYLPKLDDYLASLEAPRFTPLSGKGKEKETEREPQIFPPMDRLGALGQTIEELEANSPFPSWKNRGTILGGVVNVFLGLTVSSIVLFVNRQNSNRLFHTGIQRSCLVL